MAVNSSSSSNSSTGSKSTGSAGSKSTGSQSSSKTSAGGATTSKSTGNFSGGRLPGLGGQSFSSWSGSGSETAAAHASGVQGPGLASGNFGSAWSGNGNHGSGSGNYTFNNTTYSNNKSEPVMTVDEVYGKTENTIGISGNQSIVERQGDYAASSNEKSDVDTSTFGKQDNITVTPESVTENKGLVDNSAIDSIEGLNFQQKDKESQDVMEARKSRDEAEAEDKANQMKDDLKAMADKTSEENEVNQFQIGEEAASNEKAALDEATKEYDDLRSQVDERLSKFNEAQNDYVRISKEMPNVDAKDISSKTVTLSDGNEITYQTYTGADPEVKAYFEKFNAAIDNLVSEDKSYYNYVNSYNEAKAKVDKATEAYNNAFVGTSEENTTSGTKQAFDNAIQNAVEKGADEQTVQAMTDIAANIEDTKAEMQKAIAENDIPAYVEAQKRYNENLDKALEIGNRLTQTDFNKDFVAAVAIANDFDVTLADGTKMSYSEFATDMATKSPEIAKAMYEAKAQKYEAEGHPVLAKIENMKAAMVGTWLGSKLTQADNQVRGQFNQMAKTNMRATYAAYNNVLNDPNATPEQKADAEAQISQANSLMTASAALQASTGFLSGIGDSMKDGVYGTTDPTALKTYQETLNAVDNFVKITLGLGVTPGANKAYQNMYYMAGAKVNESGLFSKDFDSDGFALCQEYGNNAAAGMIAGAGELATGVALFFNPAMSGMALNLVVDSVTTFTNGLYGVQKDAIKAEKYTKEVLGYFREAESIAADTGNKEALDAIQNGITQIENFELKQDEVGNLDNWLEGSGSNTATNEKFNQALSYDEWLKLIEADPTMRDYAKKLIAEKKNK